jgi:two-component system, cell cycle response regulator
VRAPPAPPPGAGREPPSQVEELKTVIECLKEAAASNEQRLKKSQERELELLRAADLGELLSVATTGLAGSFALEAVTLVLADPDHEIRHLLLGAGQRPDDLPDVIFTDAVAGLAPQAAVLHRPWLGAYVRPDHELLFPGRRNLESIALLPLRRAGREAGVLCLASRERDRFTHRLGSDYLQHLGAVLGVCLENACNRARVLRSGLADYLTGWHNRRYLQARLREELARAQRRLTSVSCLMVDVDHFKAVNDRHGHLGGDAVLREITTRIEGQIRASDTAARFGGDEFALLLPDTSLAEAAQLAERIRTAMSAAIELAPGLEHRATLSIGAASLTPPRQAGDLKALGEQLLAEADAALYRAKAAGRDRVVLGEAGG